MADIQGEGNGAVMANPAPWCSVILFTSVMGWSGLIEAWARACTGLDGATELFHTVRVLPVVLFGLVLAFYVIDWSRDHSTMAREFRDSGTGWFFIAIAIDLMLIADTLPQDVAAGVWESGAALHILLSGVLCCRWWRKPRSEREVNPPLLMPVIGACVVAKTGVPLGFQFLPKTIFWCGVALWFAVAPSLIWRMWFGEPMMADKTPSVFLALSPPAVGTLGFLALGHDITESSTVCLIAIGVLPFFAMLLLERRFWTAPLSVRSWAFCFPTANLASVALISYGATQSPKNPFVAAALVAVPSALVLAVSFVTLRYLVVERPRRV